MDPDFHYDLDLPLNDPGEVSGITFQNSLSAPGGDLDDYINITVPGEEVERFEVTFILLITCSGPGAAVATLSVADQEWECGETFFLDIFNREDVGIRISVRPLSIAIMTYTIRAELHDGPGR